MIFKSHGRAPLSVVSLICTFGMVSAATAHSLTAPNSPSAQNEWKGGSTGLGSSHRFPDLQPQKPIAATLTQSSGLMVTA